MATTKVTFVDPQDLAMEIEVDAEGKVVKDDAASLHILYTECMRNSQDMDETYRRFKEQLSLRWGTQITAHTAYMVVEAVVKLTSDAKKKHFNLADSKSSESALPVSTNQK